MSNITQKYLFVTVNWTGSREDADHVELVDSVEHAREVARLRHNEGLQAGRFLVAKIVEELNTEIWDEEDERKEYERLKEKYE